MAVKSFEKHMFFFAYLVLFVVSFAISYLFLVHQQQGMLLFGPNRGDAAGYILSSRNLVPAMMGGIRTYAYPLFLKLIRYPYTISVLEMQLFSMYILVIQYTLYAASVSFFAFSITKDRTIRLIIVAALLLQINTLSYLSVTLTETLSLSALLVSCAIFFGIKQGVWRAFLLGLLTAFSVEIRPANLWVYGFILISFLLEFSDYKNNKVEFLKQLAFFAVGSLISFMPQLYWNWTFFHAITPLPAGNLAQIQQELGMQYPLVAFSLIPGDTWLPVIQNPFFISSAYPFEWLTINGLSYALLKVLIMFNHTDLFVYQSIRESYQTIMIFISSLTTYFGLLGILFQYKNISIKKRRFMLLGLLSCILLHLNTRLEDRFTLAICLLLAPFALYQFLSFCKGRKYNYLLGAIPVFLCANLFTSMLTNLSTTTYLPPDKAPHRKVLDI